MEHSTTGIDRLAVASTYLGGVAMSDEATAATPNTPEAPARRPAEANEATLKALRAENAALQAKASRLQADREDAWLLGGLAVGAAVLLVAS